MATKEELEKRVAELEAMNKRAEKTIRENQKMFQLVIDSIPQFIAWKDVDSVYLGCNQNLAQVAGVENPADIVGKTDHDLAWKKEEADAFRADDHAVMAGDTPKYHIIEPQLQADGKEAWLDTNKIPLHDDEGNVVGVLVTFEDITKRIQAEEELKAQQEFFRQVIDISPNLFFVKDRAGRFILVNQVLADFYGISVDDMIGKTDADFNPNKEEVESYLQADLEVMDSLQKKIIPEESITDAAGTEYWLQTIKLPLVDKDGIARRILGVASDITARKKAEQEREHLQQEIIAAQHQSIQELSTPVIPIMDRIIVMPMIGTVDSMRARDITRSLLTGIGQHRAKIVILDVTGVSIMDTGIVNHLNKTIQAARLKGARTIVTGISDAVAESIVDLGIDWSAITTLSDLQTGLIVALESLGVELGKK